MKQKNYEAACNCREGAQSDAVAGDQDLNFAARQAVHGGFDWRAATGIGPLDRPPKTGETVFAVQFGLLPVMRMRYGFLIEANSGSISGSLYIKRPALQAFQDAVIAHAVDGQGLQLTATVVGRTKQGRLVIWV